MSSTESSPAAPRAAATVVIVKPDFSVLLVQRSRAVGFFAGAYAFAGGRIEAQDVAAGDVPRSAAMGDIWQGHRAAPAGLDALAGGDRARLYAGYVRGAVREVSEEVGLALAPAAFKPWARWITPAREPKRYDTLFFVAFADQAEASATDGQELVGHAWWRPDEAIARARAGEIVLPPPTWVVLAELAALGSTAALAAACAGREVPEIMPVIEGDDPMLLLFPGDAAHPASAEVAWRPPAGVSTRARIDGGSGGWHFV